MSKSKKQKKSKKSRMEKFFKNLEKKITTDPCTAFLAGMMLNEVGRQIFQAKAHQIIDKVHRKSEKDKKPS